MHDLKNVTIFGFVFGTIFSIIAYLSNFEVDRIFLWLIPFFVAFLCALGEMITSLVSSILTSKGISNPFFNISLSFISAIIVNGVIVSLMMAYNEGTTINQEVVLGSLIGIAMGAIYGLYRYRMDRIEEKVNFLKELSQKNLQIQEASRKLAIIEERNRMGRDLHDSVSQGLHGLIYSLHSLKNELHTPPERVYKILSYMETTANATLDELRTMIEELKPSLLAEEGLKAALTVYVDLFSQRKEVPVKLIIELPSQITPSLELAIYRISQEALANIEKHANPKHVQVKISHDDDYIVLAFSDDGEGFVKNKTSKGNGLENMRQRVEEEEGVLDIISKPGIGTTIIAKFPQKG